MILCTGSDCFFHYKFSLYVYASVDMINGNELKVKEKKTVDIFCKTLQIFEDSICVQHNTYLLFTMKW